MQTFLINYQGVLTDTATGDPFDGNFDLRFEMFEAEAGGTAIWIELHAGVAVAKGLFSVLLGSSIPLQPEFFNLNVPVFLEIQVNGEVLAPRQRLSAVPFAVNAAALGGLSSSEFAEASHLHTEADLALTNLNVTNDLVVGGTTTTQNLQVAGTKNAIVETSGGSLLTYAVESPEVWFEDFGSARLEAGRAIIAIEPLFAETVNTEVDYHVFLTPLGKTKGLYVAKKTPLSFEVRDLSGAGDVRFDYRITGKRRGYEDYRLEPARGTAVERDIVGEAGGGTGTVSASYASPQGGAQPLWSVAGAAGRTASSSSFRLVSTAGQSTPVGISASDNFTLSAGFVGGVLRSKESFLRFFIGEPPSQRPPDSRQRRR